MTEKTAELLVLLNKWKTDKNVIMKANHKSGDKKELTPKQLAKKEARKAERKAEKAKE